MQLEWCANNIVYESQLSIAGEHNAMNALAAMAAGMAMGVTGDNMAMGTI